MFFAPIWQDKTRWWAGENLIGWAKVNRDDGDF
jgi:hypothetical protein